MNQVRVITCASGCKAELQIQGKTLEDVEKEVEPLGWIRLYIVPTKFRCPACVAALTQAQAITGPPGEFVPDTLPKDSVGALKEPQGMMTQPSVSSRTGRS